MSADGDPPARNILIVGISVAPGGESGSAREAHRRYREGVFSGAPENPEREEDVLAVDASFFGCPSSSVRWTRVRERAHEC